MTDYQPKIKCSEIHRAFKDIPRTELWSYHFAWVRTLKEFWEGAVQKYSKISGTADEKLNQHISNINLAFDLMDDWKNERIRYVKARRKEIDSAISFIRNNALNNDTADLLISPISGNVASLLRLSLYISTNGYKEEQLPLLYAKSIYELGAVRSYFPIDTSNLMSFLPFGKGLDGSSEAYSEDNWHLMMEIAAEKIGIGKFVVNLNNEANLVWQNYKTPIKLIVPPDIWDIKTDGVSKDLYHLGMTTFYSR